MENKIFNLVTLVTTIVILKNHQTYSANILAFITDHSRSHCIIQETLMKALVKRGHNVSNYFYLKLSPLCYVFLI